MFCAIIIVRPKLILCLWCFSSELQQFTNTEPLCRPCKLQRNFPANRHARNHNEESEQTYIPAPQLQAVLCQLPIFSNLDWPPCCTGTHIAAIPRVKKTDKRLALVLDNACRHGPHELQLNDYCKSPNVMHALYCHKARKEPKWPGGEWSM
jgi:hypothetical protein